MTRVPRATKPSTGEPDRARSRPAQRATASRTPNATAGSPANASANHLWQQLATQTLAPTVGAAASGNEGPADIQRLCSDCAKTPQQEDDEQEGLPALQPKLAIGPPRDAYELEADAVSERVTRAPTPETDAPPAMGPGGRQPDRSIQRLCPTCSTTDRDGDEEPLRPKAGGTATTGHPSTAALRTIASPGAGAPVPHTVRDRVEPVLGADLGGVRVHRDAGAREAAASIGARAFTHRHRIFLGPGERADDLGLMAHELTHTVQQGAAPTTPAADDRQSLRASPETSQDSTRPASSHGGPPEPIQRAPGDGEQDKVGNLTVTYGKEARFVQSAAAALNAGGLVTGEVFDRSADGRLIGVGLSEMAFLVGPFSSDMGNFVYVYTFGSKGEKAIDSLARKPLVLGWQGFDTVDEIESKFNDIRKILQGSSPEKPSETQEAPGTQPASPADTAQGGTADVTNLEQDMRDLLTNWKEAAKDGAEDFADAELLSLIAGAQSSDWGGFLVTLLGNTVWAAAAFSPVAREAFAVSMIGVAIGMTPSIPSQTRPEEILLEVKKMLRKYINDTYDQLNGTLRKKAEALIKENPGIKRYPALAKFVKASFKTGLYHKILLTYDKPPTLDKTAITEKYASVARELLGFHKAFASSKTQTFRGEYFVTNESRAAYIGSGSGRRLAVLNYHGSGTLRTEPGSSGRGTFGGGSRTTTRKYISRGVRISYVPAELADSILEMHRNRWATEPLAYKDEDAARASWQ